MQRIPASEQTREKLKALMEGRSEAEDGRSQLVRLAARQLAAFAGVIAVTAVMGCAPRQQPVWYNVGATQSDFDRDRYQCMRETLASGAGAQNSAAALDPNFGRNEGIAGALAKTLAGSSGQAEQTAFANACMQAKGYHQ